MTIKILWLVLSLLSTSSCSESLPPSWQTIFPDAKLVVPLFGDEGPKWTLESTDGAYRDISANIPGDILSDLMKAGEIGDPYFSRNFLTQRNVWMGHPLDDNSTKPQQRTRTWKYTTKVALDMTTTKTTNRTWILVVEGVKMGASISWNGKHVGIVNDQFLRYTFQVDNSMLEAVDPLSQSRHLERSRLHELSISFDPSIGTDGRYMACSGGWDWAPYSRSVDDRGSPVFSFGIVKPIYLVAVQSIFVSHVVPKIYYKGPYPREPMRDGPLGDFVVSVDVHLETVADASSSSAMEGLLIAVRSDFSKETIYANATSVKPGNSTVVAVTLIASKDHIKLWWPNGMGNQPLYHLDASIQDSSYQLVTPWIRKRIGFRTTALVTVNDTDDSVVDDILSNNREGSGSHGMYFRVNGAAIWNRGANFIPMDQLEGRLTDRAHRLAVQSAAAAHMNMLRVWGGGMILPDAFYDACDENGILLYHDMMFVEEQGHGALRSQTVENEMRHIIRSLAPHASIVVWNGCNECTYFEKDIEIYAEYVMQTVAEEDDTRSIWPTSPSSHGWKAGVSMLDGRPNGNRLQTATEGLELSPKPIENHGPYQHGWSKTHPSVNGQFDGRTYDTNTPPILQESQIGVIFPNMFTSEFGSSVFSSFESMSETLEEQDWGVHGGSPPDTCHLVYGNLNECNGTNVLAERNYACDSHIHAYFGAAALDEIGEAAFKSQLYLCMLSQALWIKGQIEVFRASNSFGALIWQLNEIWPTGGWGSIEYDGVSDGGRWKPLMHIIQDSLYRDVFVACGEGGKCYARNDAADLAATVTIALEGWNRDGKQLAWVQQETIKLSSGPGSIVWFQVPLQLWNGTDVILIRAFDARGSQLMGESVTFLDVPATMVALAENTSISVTSQTNYALVTLESNHLSLYVTLTTRAKGKFSDNSFHLRPKVPKVVKFKSLTMGEAVDMKLLEATIRADHLVLATQNKEHKAICFSALLSNVVSTALLSIQLGRL